MSIFIGNRLKRIRIYSNRLRKYLNIYIILSSVYFLIKSIQAIYTLHGVALSILAAIIFPLTIFFYPLSLVFSADYTTLFGYQIFFYFLPILVRLITRANKGGAKWSS